MGSRCVSRSTGSRCGSKTPWGGGGGGGQILYGAKIGDSFCFIADM